MSKERSIDLLILGLVLVIFWAATCYQLRLPGLYYDEAADVTPAMQILQGDAQPLHMSQFMQAGPLRLPVMVWLHVGAVSTYAVLPFFWLFGVTVEAMRAMTIFMASLGIVFAYFFLKELFDRRVAAPACLLVAVHPSFVFWSRMGIHVSSPMLPLATGALFFLLRWRRRGQAPYLYAAAFLTGLGLSAKLLFLWFIVAVAVAAVLLGLLPRVRLGRLTIGQDHSRQALPLHTLLLGLAAFAAGAWMFIWYNLTTGGTIRFMVDNMLKTGAGVNNLDIVGNMRIELDALFTLLNGSWYQEQWGGAAVNLVLPAAFALSVAVLLGLLRARRLPWPDRRLAFLLLFVALIWLQSCFTVTGLGPTHLYILYPFPQALIVLAALALVPRRRSLVLIGALVLVLFAGDARCTIDHHRALARTGGLGGWSDAVYALAADLDGHAGPVVAADWGFRYNIAMLTRGAVWPVEVYGADVSAPQADFGEEIGPYLAQTDAVFLFHVPEHTAFRGRYAAAEQMLAQIKRKLVVVRVYGQRDGAPTILLCRSETASP